MKRIYIALVACMIALPVMTFAQGEPGWNKSSLGANAELSLPMGDFADFAGVGYGGNVRYQYGADTRAAFTATAGYLVWSEKDLPGGTGQPKAFSIFLGGKYYIAGGFYGSLEGGLYFVTYEKTGTRVEIKADGTAFMLPIGVGFQSNGFEVGVRYMILDVDINSFSFTLGYNFNL
jgi:hypothetical protein